MSQQRTPRSLESFRPWALLAGFFLAIVPLTIAAAPGPAAGRSQNSAPAQAAAQTTYPTPDAALAALVTAVEAKDRPALDKLFGPEATELFSGDPVEDNKDLDHFAASLRSSATLQKDAHGGYTILVGKKAGRFRSPSCGKRSLAVRHQSRPRRDPESQNRRRRTLGHRHLPRLRRRAVGVLHREWRRSPTDLAVYAQQLHQLARTPRWSLLGTGSDEKPSPLGELVADARVEGYGPRTRVRPGRRRSNPAASLHGYYLQHPHRARAPAHPAENSATSSTAT